MNSSLVFLNIVFFVFFISCNNNCCDKIINSFNKQCLSNEDKCKVSFEETFCLDWDTLYIVDSMLYPDEVSNVIGISYDGKIVPDGEKLFIYIRGGHIVKELNETCSNITFVGIKNNGVVRIESQNLYKMKRKILNGKEHYLVFKN